MANALQNENLIFFPGCEDETAYMEDRTSTPIKDPEDVKRVCDWFEDREMYLMKLVFIIGVNTAWRISDILSLRWTEVLNPEDNTVRDYVLRPEKKTRKSKPKGRKVFLNDIVKDSIAAYIARYPNKVFTRNRLYIRNTYVFESERRPGTHITRQFVDKWLKIAIADLDINSHAGTHMMRKTFVYHHITQSKDRPRAIEQCMYLLNHSSIRETLRYAGITEDEQRDAYHNVMLGTAIENIKEE